MVEIRKQLAPKLLPRYVTSIEERVFIGAPDDARVPDVWVQKVDGGPPSDGGGTVVLAETEVATPLRVRVGGFVVRERYVEILDMYRDQRVVTVIEVVSPTNKRQGVGRKHYLRKQRATLASETHLVEIDLLRTGRQTVASPDTLKKVMPEHDYLISVNRADDREQFDLYPIRLRERLPRFYIPLAEPDQDVPLDLQAALDQVYQDGAYMLRVKYDQPCVPPLDPADQEWASECWAVYRKQHPELFGRGTNEVQRPDDATPPV